MGIMRQESAAAMNDTFKALADGTRREILELLRQRDMNAGEIASYFNISKPSISHHLNSLKQANLVSVERKGQELIYTLNTTVLDEFLAFVFARFGSTASDAPPRDDSA
jgi:ArsR family transcriptional regulator